MIDRWGDSARDRQEFDRWLCDDHADDEGAEMNEQEYAHYDDPPEDM